MNENLQQTCDEYVLGINGPNRYHFHLQLHHIVGFRMMDSVLEFENVLHVSFVCQTFGRAQNTNNRYRHRLAKMAWLRLARGNLYRQPL